MSSTKSTRGSKGAMKARIAAAQGGVDAISGEPLATDSALIDTDRIHAKALGGTYTEDNTRVLEPRSHMARHGNLRVRETSLDELKSIFDDRVQVMRLALKINNQLLAYERRTDRAHPETAEFLKAQLVPIDQRLGVIDRQMAKAIASYPDKLAQAGLGVPGLGPVTVTALTVYVDLKKQICIACRRPLATEPAQSVDDFKASGVCACTGEITLVDAAATASALWKYVGLDKASHERYTKGEAGGGNKTLRTVLWNTANVLMKLGDKSAYRIVYDQTKDRLAVSERIVKTRNTQGKLIECAWRDTKPSHRHGAALRAVVKHVLCDYWYVGRTLLGHTPRPLYAEAMLGHTHIAQPSQRGWKF